MYCYYTHYHYHYHYHHYCSKKNKQIPKTKQNNIQDMINIRKSTTANSDTSGSGIGSVVIQNIYGLSVPLGNTNFFQETYRKCDMTMKKDYCP